jgi:hypothetical protein
MEAEDHLHRNKELGQITDQDKDYTLPTLRKLHESDLDQIGILDEN